MILVDSSVWIAYFNGADSWQVSLLDDLLQREPVCIGDIILAEVLQGFRTDRDFNTAKEILDTLPFVTLGGYAVAIQSASNYRTLRKNGFTVRKTVDVIIGTFCMMEGYVLLHADRDFDPMVELLGLCVCSPGK